MHRLYDVSPHCSSSPLQYYQNTSLLLAPHATLAGEVSSLQAMMHRLYDVSAAASASASMRASLALQEHVTARDLQRHQDQDQEWGQRDWDGNRYGGQRDWDGNGYGGQREQEEEDAAVRAAGFFARGVPLDATALQGPGGIDAALKALGLDVA